MKVYPSFHGIEETKRINPKDIPLSYLETDAVEKKIVVKKESISSKGDTVVGVRPYDFFDSPDTYLFDENGERVDEGISLQRVDDKYYFVPQNATEFMPTHFSFNALVKKEMTFQNDKNYNIKIGCVDGESGLSERLISIFGDAPRRKLSPNNISINNQDTSPYSLTNSSFKENDFVFIESDDGVHYGSTENKIEIDDILKDHTNIWLSVKDFGEVLVEPSDLTTDPIVEEELDYEDDGIADEEDGEEVIEDEEFEFKFELETTNIYENNKYELYESNKVFDLRKKHGNFHDYNYINLFIDNCPILLLEKEKMGYIIISEESFLEDVDKNVKLIYEILMGIFFESYYRSENNTTWITDSVVDYISMKENKHGMNHGKVYLSDVLYNVNYTIESEYKLIQVETSEGNVFFQGISDEGVLLFAKHGEFTDPKKNNGYISVYTTRGTVMHYKGETINKVETNLNVKTFHRDTGDYIEIGPYKSTSLKIYSSMKQSLNIPRNNSSHALVCKDSIFSLIPSHIYNEASDGIKMAEIKRIERTTTKNHDLRILGGGLPEDESPNYNLLDIGLIDGRPYRVGSTMIITLPKRLKEYEKVIEDAVYKHSSSGDYPIIVFE